MAHGVVPLAVLLGLMSACAFAASNALQHQVAGTVPTEVSRALGVLAILVRKPVWLVATTISFCAVILHATALRAGSIALVQPLMLVGVVLAVPLRAALERQAPSWPEVRAVLITMAGLGTILWSADPAPSTARPSVAAAGALVVGGITTAVCVLRCSRRMAGRPRAQAAILGANAGVMFGLTAGLLKYVASAAAGPNPATLVLPVCGLVGAGVLGTAMNQRAYQLASLSVSMPLVNVIDVIVAVTFGAVVFHELPGHSPDVLLLQVAALACLGLGLQQIARLGTARTRPERRVVDPACAR
jgi:glucose uptake protein GlcU